MNAQAERLISRRGSRVFGATYLGKIAAWVRLKHQAYRTRRLAVELQETLEAMSPELLEDIGIDVTEFGKPAPRLARQNPYVIAVEVLTLSPRYHDPS